MKFLVKRTFCPYCKKLVAGREEHDGRQKKVLCSRCGKALWVHDGLHLKYAAVETKG